MSVYTPDTWVFLKIINSESEPIYKVLAGWYGGYTGADSWKLNSGIVSITETDDMYEVLGSSGGIYNCYKSCQKLSMYTASILASFEETITGHGSIEIVDSIPSLIKQQ